MRPTVVHKNIVPNVADCKTNQAIYTLIANSIRNENQLEALAHAISSEIKEEVQRVADMVLAINSKYKYPRMLISTVIEGAHQQKYFAEHLPSLTNTTNGDEDITIFYTTMILSTIYKK